MPKLVYPVITITKIIYSKLGMRTRRLRVPVTKNSPDFTTFQLPAGVVFPCDSYNSAYQNFDI